jgi:AMP-polyphosphate phosphotransferase
MLEYLNLDLAVAQEEYRPRIRQLQQRLYELEHAVFDAKIPVIIVFEGWAACGKGKLIRNLAERMDPRGFRVVPITPPRTAETRYPWMWRFWLQIPAYGQMVAFDTSWYRRVLIDRISQSIGENDLARAYQEIAEFEEQLAADGAIILKFWLHISKKEQKKRFKKLLSDELTAWQVSEADKLQHQKYDQYYQAAEDMFVRTDSPHAPWTIVEANDRYHARIKVFETIIQTIEFKIPDDVLQRSREEMKGAVDA